MEKLYAYAFLWKFGLCNEKDYNEILNDIFLDNPTNEFLLELEWCSDNQMESFALLKRYFEYETEIFESEKFGKAIFTGLESKYRTLGLDIKEFSEDSYELWNLLPEFLRYNKPYITLCNAGDSLSWGDEEQTRKLFEESFCYYKV